MSNDNDDKEIGMSQLDAVELAADKSDKIAGEVVEPTLNKLTSMNDKVDDSLRLIDKSETT